MTILEKIDKILIESKMSDLDLRLKSLPKVKGWKLEADDKFEMDYNKELPNGDMLHLTLNDIDFPTDGSAVITYSGSGSKKSKSTSFNIKSEKDIPNVLKKVERWA